MKSKHRPKKHASHEKSQHPFRLPIKPIDFNLAVPEVDVNSLFLLTENSKFEALDSDRHAPSMMTYHQ